MYLQDSTRYNLYVVRDEDDKAVAIIKKSILFDKASEVKKYYILKVIDTDKFCIYMEDVFSKLNQKFSNDLLKGRKNINYKKK